MTKQTNKNKTAGTLNAASSPASGTKAAEQPNIKFVGRPTFAPGKRKILEDPQPLEAISFAGDLVKLPNADFQNRRRLFYHVRAAEIVATFPNLYKLVKQKGS